jgi:hypothetical protein
MMYSYSTKVILMALVCWGTIVETTQAHHSMSPHYDSSKPVTITGFVTDFKFVSPHSFVYVDVEQDDGSFENWSCEMQPAVVLRRLGWTEQIFAPGTGVTINGVAARRNPYGCAFVSGETDRGIEIAARGILVRDSTETDTVSIPTSQPNTEVKSIFGRWRTGPRYMPFGDLSGDLTSVPRGSEDLPSLEDFGTPENPLGIYAEYLTEEGKAAASAYDVLYDDPALMCSGTSIMRAWTEPAGISEITRRDNQILIKHEYMDVVRTIDMDNKEHPEQIEPSMVGHSIGWYEGEELVIDTVGFEAGVLFPHPGVLHSAEMHVVERLSLSEEGDQLIKDYVATDPLYFSKPMLARVIWNRSDRPLLRYDCVELGVL